MSGGGVEPVNKVPLNTFPTDMNLKSHIPSMKLMSVDIYDHKMIKMNNIILIGYSLSYMSIRRYASLSL